MIETAGMARAEEFLSRTEDLLLYDPYEQRNIEELIKFKTERIKDAVHSLSFGLRESSIFDYETPIGKTSSKHIAAYSEFAAWQCYLSQQDQEFRNVYYNARPFSPYYLSEEEMEDRIKAGHNEPSDRDIWVVAFMHPNGSHFYEIKYTPGVDGVGWRYRGKVSNVLRNYDALMKDIGSGRRYPLDHIEP